MIPAELKRFALSAFHRGGIDRIGVSLHSRDALVLVYHGILTEERAEPFRYHHTVLEFSAHLEWLGRRYTPASLSDFARWRRGEWRPRKPIVLVTFDDGYLNNATVAAPLLRRVGFPALFFIATGYIQAQRVLWPDEVFARVRKWPRATLQDPAGVAQAVPDRPEAREAMALAIVEACKNCSDARRREFMTYLALETKDCDPLQDREAQGFMSWDDVRGLADAGFDIGSHTASHPILSNLSREQLRDELRESRAEIETRTGARCRALAYPNGRTRDISELVLSETAAAGYEFAFTVSNRWCRRASDALALDRVSPPGHSSLPTFALHASGWRQWLAL
ncbi:MAG: polysaccharide deacetylase family protein [Candidatus Cybelea sp.]